MKICFIAHNLRPYNGGGVFTSNVVAGLRDLLSAEIKVVTAVPSGFLGEEVLLSPGWFLSPRAVSRIRQLIKNSDVVHAFDPFPYGALAALLSIGTKAKLIITAVGTGSVRYLYMPIPFLLSRFALRKAKRITAISNFTKNEMLKRIPNLSIGVINPGINLSRLSITLPDEKYLRPKSFAPYILSVGSLRLRKGYKWSIAAFKRISEIYPDLNYVIIGKKYTDKEFNRLHGLVVDLGLAGKVHILHDVSDEDELTAFYRQAKLFCLMSFNYGHDVEGFGIVFLEAAVAGLPVVGTRDSGVVDATAGGRNGILVKWDDIDEFANAIISILKDDALYRQFSEASRELVKDFDWSKKINGYVKIYRGLLK